MTVRRLLPAIAVLALILATAYAQPVDEPLKPVGKAAEREAEAKAAEAAKRDAEDAARKDSARRDKAYKQTLKVYEWGVTTMNWDGSAAGPDDVPALYYDPSEVPLETAPADKSTGANPQPEPEKKPPVMKPRKPVLYFECANDVLFDLDIKFTSGKLTWMYPKPNRMTDAATVQWDNVQLYADGLPRDKFAVPELAQVDANHWANFSRDGSESSLVVNGEHERFLFYEGEIPGLPEADIFLNVDGDIVIHNHSAHEIFDVRVCIERDGNLLKWHIAKVPAASGEKPGEFVIGDLRQSRADLATETQAAGLTATQAAVFEREWADDFAKAGTLSWRRTEARLDELMQLTLTLPAGVGSDVQRVGYVMVSNVDLTRQAEFEALVTKAAEGDANAEASLKAGGTAAAGALRRAIAGDMPLKTRLKLAKVLAEMAG